jgi:hypothetical protein
MLFDSTLDELSESVLVAHGWPAFAEPFDIYGEPPTLPTSPGVYAILIADGEPLRYPRGKTTVIYFGCTSGQQGLRHRLGEHRLYARQCRAETAGRIYYPRYEWVNAAGGMCLYAQAPEDGISPEHMEALLLTAFESIHYTLPVGNRQHGAEPKHAPVSPDPSCEPDIALPSTSALPAPTAQPVHR